MQIVDFSADTSASIDAYGSARASVARLARGDGISVVCIRLDAGGAIGRHDADSRQLFALVEGRALVSGGDGKAETIVPGKAALWESGESHETFSPAGCVAIVIEGSFEL